ncbi:MAG: HAD-IIIA family hydrolase [Bacteroidetes bacterium]|nr:HAD-IIIA family hydrolase [Bacteroidota bacterium]
MKTFPTNFDNNWTLFIDRDGVINHRLVDDYVKKSKDFKFQEGVLNALQIFNLIFGKIVIVTNQQGIGKGLMTEDELHSIHQDMIHQIKNNKGRIDQVYFCPDLKESGSFYRKPNIGMGLKAKKDFKEIIFKKSLMIGDSLSDMIFGKKLGMKTVFISDNLSKAKQYPELIDFISKSLIDFAKLINNNR